MYSPLEMEREREPSRLKGIRDYNTNMINREIILEEGRKEGRDLERRNAGHPGFRRASSPAGDADRSTSVAFHIRTGTAP